MDYVLDIIIPKIEVEKVRLNEELIELGDCIYPCEPPQYITDSNIVFEQIKDIPYFSRKVGEELTDDVVVLNLKSEILFDLEYAINASESMLEQNLLFVFLHELLKLSMFYILLIREDEEIKERYEIKTKEDMLVGLSESLKWSNPKDVLLFKKQDF